MDETWLHHFTPESNRQSAEWTARDEPTPKRGKTQKSAGKVMTSAFWDTHGIIFIDYLKKGKKRDYYVALLERLKCEIAEKRPHLKKKKVLFHQDNAPCHKSMKSMAKLHELGFELLPHPPYTPNLAPSDFFLFSDLKKMLAGQKFRTDEEVIAETEAYFEAKDKSYYKNGIEKLYGRYHSNRPRRELY
ncbi:mariner Mos1 transposase [Trichonephila clavipes]|nr:mariner Mos1 transposase [Trichonephila clavipes]